MCLKLPFFVGAVALTLLHSAMCAVLIVLMYTDSTILTFDASNAPAFFFWQLIPVTLAVIPGLMWEVFYIEVCRLQPYRDLTRRQGSRFKDSLSQTYLTTFSWFVPYHALKHANKHTGLAMISIAYLLSYGILPTVTIAMIKIEWDDSFTEGTAQPLIYFVGLGLLVSISTVAFAITAFMILQRQKTGLYNNPASLAGLGSLVAESTLLENFQSLCSFETQEGIDKALGDFQLVLEHTGTSYQIALLDPSQTVPKMATKKWQRDINEAHPWWLRGRTHIGLNFLMLVPTVVMFVVLYQQAYAAALDNDPTEINGNNFIVRVCVAILSVGGAAVYANWHLHVAILQPFHKLTERPVRQGNPKKAPQKPVGSSNALQMDFTGSAVFNLMQRGQSAGVWLMAVCAFLTQLTVIIRPATFQNLAFFTVVGAQSSSDPFASDLFENITVPAGVAPLRIIFYVFEAIYLVLALGGFLLVMTRKRKPFLPRKPYTLSSRILYLCHGTDLLEDLKEMSTLTTKGRDTRLKQNGHKYALGWVEDEAKTCSYVGIDRLENVERRFKYPKSDPNPVQRQKLGETYARLHPGQDEYKTRRDAGWPDNAQ